MGWHNLSKTTEGRALGFSYQCCEVVAAAAAVTVIQFIGHPELAAHADCHYLPLTRLNDTIPNPPAGLSAVSPKTYGTSYARSPLSLIEAIYESLICQIKKLPPCLG
jgi:hypothetical protein